VKNQFTFGVVLCILTALSTLGTPILVHSADEKVLYVPGSTQKVCQLTGEIDQQLGQFTFNQTKSSFGVIGTDLGFPVEHNGKLYFLFGDTSGNQGTAVDPAIEFNPPATPPVPPPPPTLNLDSVAYSMDTLQDLEAQQCIGLQFVTDPTRATPIYIPPQVSLASYPANVPHIGHGTFRVPVSGFSWNGKLYAFFASALPDENKPERRSILAVLSDTELQQGNLGNFQYVYDVSRFGGASGYPGDPGNVGKFINIAPVIVNNAAIPGLPRTTGQGLLLWGSGQYRKSDPYLAYVPLDSVEDRSAWRYFTSDANGQPIWLPNAEAATQSLLQSHPGSPVGCVGELSVSWNPHLQKWLMLYNCGDDPRGIRFHVADLPWGPWSKVQLNLPDRNILFDPAPQVDHGYLNFMHLVLGGPACQNDSACNDNNPSTTDRCNPIPDPQTNEKSCQHSFNDGLEDSSFGRFVPHTLGASFVSDGPRTWEVGGEYAPYVISRYTTGDTKSTTIHFMMSTWNPYQAVLMKSTLRLERPPVANAGPDQTVSADATCMAQVTLDGRGSSDPDDDPLTYTWTGTFGTVIGPTPTVTLPLGTFKITLTVDDGFGGTASDEVVITVQDTTPPTLTVALAPNTLWPPNHKLVPITATIQVSDNCDPTPTVQLMSITSNESDNGLGDGDTPNDIQGAAVGTADRAFLLRAERSGTGTGRIYTVTYRAEDRAGNATTAQGVVTVPHDQP